MKFSLCRLLNFCNDCKLDFQVRSLCTEARHNSTNLVKSVLEKLAPTLEELEISIFPDCSKGDTTELLAAVDALRNLKKVEFRMRDAENYCWKDVCTDYAFKCLCSLQEVVLNSTNPYQFVQNLLEGVNRTLRVVDCRTDNVAVVEQLAQCRELREASFIGTEHLPLLHQHHITQLDKLKLTISTSEKGDLMPLKEYLDQDRLPREIHLKLNMDIYSPPPPSHCFSNLLQVAPSFRRIYALHLRILCRTMVAPDLLLQCLNSMPALEILQITGIGAAVNGVCMVCNWTARTAPSLRKLMIPKSFIADQSNSCRCSVHRFQALRPLLVIHLF